jgi:hypothetical protein
MKDEEHRPWSTERRGHLLVAVPFLCSALFILHPSSFILSQEVPLVGRPADLPFSEASGWFTASASAHPTILEAQAPLTLTLTVRATHPDRMRRPPQRIDLRELPRFASAFHIEDVTDGQKANKSASTWEFVYRLKPRNQQVPEVPSLPLAFYNPDILSPEKRFQVVYTDPITLRVLPPKTVVQEVDAPEEVFVLASQPGLLDEDTPWALPGAAALTILLLGPALVCAGYYVRWRRRHPDAALLAQRRRSRAARLALAAVRKAQAPEGVVSAVVGYLRQRLGLAGAEPTPAEVAALLRAQGYPSEVAGQAERFFEAGAAARFRPGHPSAGLTAEAAALIWAVEDTSCPPHS